MRFNRIEGIRDGGNHALTRVNEVWKCAFCGNSCAEAAMIFFASNPCVSRARPLQFIDKEAFAALVTDIQTGAGTKRATFRKSHRRARRCVRRDTSDPRRMEVFVCAWTQKRAEGH